MPGSALIASTCRRWNAGEQVTAVAYDNPIPGFGTANTINLRLWASRPDKEFDLEAFNTGDYVQARATPAPSSSRAGGRQSYKPPSPSPAGPRSEFSSPPLDLRPDLSPGGLGVGQAPAGDPGEAAGGDAEQRAVPGRPHVRGQGAPPQAAALLRVCHVPGASASKASGCFA